MPPRFAWWDGDIWIPVAIDRVTGNMYDRTFWLYGKLKPHVSIRQATADLDLILKRLASSHPQDYPQQPAAGLETYADSIVSSFRPTLPLLLGGVGILLLIACGNVANLLLARAAVREREIAIRSVIGTHRLGTLAGPLSRFPRSGREASVALSTRASLATTSVQIPRLASTSNLALKGKSFAKLSVRCAMRSTMEFARGYGG
jgi:hypothetical protein